MVQRRGAGQVLGEIVVLLRRLAVEDPAEFRAFSTRLALDNRVVEKKSSRRT